MFIAGFNAVLDALDAVKAEEIKVTVAQQPWMMGILA